MDRYEMLKGIAEKNKDEETSNSLINASNNKITKKNLKDPTKRVEGALIDCCFKEISEKDLKYTLGLNEINKKLYGIKKRYITDNQFNAILFDFFAISCIINIIGSIICSVILCHQLNLKTSSGFILFFLFSLFGICLSKPLVNRYALFKYFIEKNKIKFIDIKDVSIEIPYLGFQKIEKAQKSGLFNKICLCYSSIFDMVLPVENHNYSFAIIGKTVNNEIRLLHVWNIYKNTNPVINKAKNRSLIKGMFSEKESDS